MKILMAVATLCALAIVPVGADDATAQAALRAPGSVDMSAARRTHKRVPATAPVVAPAPRPLWGGVDPTYGPGTEQLRQLQREGRCVVDEGYGRWTACSNM